jgi:5-methylcytosine-specific restriction endonuclease McrA
MNAPKYDTWCHRCSAITPHLVSNRSCVTCTQLEYRRVRTDPVLWRARLDKQVAAAVANPDRYHAYISRWYASRPGAYTLKARNRRARMAQAPGMCTMAQQLGRWAMWGDKCWLCGTSATATDHVKPIAKGGSNWPANLRPICKPCNSRKGARNYAVVLL